MNVKSSGKSIQYHKVNGHLMRLECDDDCGAGAVVWGFLAAAVGLFFTVVVMCL